MEKMFKLLLELKDNLFIELEETNDQEIRKQNSEVDDLLSELHKFKIEKSIKYLMKLKKNKEQLKT